MRALDRQGRPLFGVSWDLVFYYGGQLVEYGYRESTTKPNLFVHTYPSVTFFADLSGTRYVSPQTDPRPLFYWRFPTAAVTLERAARMITIEGARLAPVPIRLTNLPDRTSRDLLALVDRSPFQRTGSKTVPEAPSPAAYRWRHQLFEALDPRSGELIVAGAKGAGRDYLRCPHCQVRVRRLWDTAHYRFCFEHPRTECTMSPR